MMPPKGAVLGGGRRKKRDFFDGGVDDRRRRRRFFFSLLLVVLERIASVAIGLASVAIVVDDWMMMMIGNDIIITKASSSSSFASHKYAFTPTNDKMEYAWAVKGRALPSEMRDAKLGTTEPEFKYMHMAMPTVLPDGSIAVGACFTGAKYAHAACSFNRRSRRSLFRVARVFFCVYACAFFLPSCLSARARIAFQASPTEYEGSIRQALYWAISKDDGLTFSTPKMIAKDDQLPVWTPVLKVSGKRVFLLYTVSSRKCRYYDQSRNALRHSPGGDVMYKVSDDNGKTWSSGQVVLSYGSEDGMPKVIANTLVELEDGSWVLPFWREPGKTCPQIKSEVKDASLLRKGSAGVIRSTDQGLTWQVFGNLTATKGESWLIENTVVERKSTTKNKKEKNNVLVQHFRTKAGVAFVSLSKDNGKTWTEAAETPLPNPNSKMHTVRIDDNIEDDSSTSFFVAAYNHHPRTRDPLVLAVSKSTDGIDSWKPFAKIEPGGMGEIIKPEMDDSLLKPGAMQYAYPTVHWTRDRKYVFVAYSVMYGARGQLTCFGIRVARMKMNEVPRP